MDKGLNLKVLENFKQRNSSKLIFELGSEVWPPSFKYFFFVFSCSGLSSEIIGFFSIKNTFVKMGICKVAYEILTWNNHVELLGLLKQMKMFLKTTKIFV